MCANDESCLNVESQEGQMNDRAYSLALQEKERLETLLKDLQKNIEEVGADLSSINHYIDVHNRLIGKEPVLRNNSYNNKPHFNNMPKEYIAEQCIRIILKNERPMNRSELYESLNKNGIVINGTEPEKVLSTMLWRMRDKVVRLPGFGYWPADLDFPAADYIGDAT